MTDTNDAIGAEALEPVQVGGETVDTPQPQENPEPELAPGAGGTEDANPDSQPADATADEADKPKKKGGFQRTIEKKDADIEKLTREKYEAELRAQVAERKLAETGKQPDLTADPGPQPTLDQFTTVDEYNAAITDWAKRQGYRQAVQEADARRKQEEQFSAVAALNAREDAARKKFADYDRSVDAVAPLILGTPALKDYVTQSEAGPEVAYHLAKNPALLLDLQKLPPVHALRELSKLEVRLSAPPPPKPVTSAPPPIKPVGQSEKAPFSLETADMDTFVKRRNEEERKARKG